MKRIVLLLLFLSSTLTNFAQVTSITSVNIGAGAFTGLSLIAEQNNYGAPEMEFLLTPAYYGGLSANINWYENLGIQIEANYAYQGQKHYAEQTGVPTDKTISLNYIQIPVLFKYTFTDYSISQRAPDLFFLVGPQFGMLQNANVTYLRNGTELGFEEYHSTIFNPLVERHPEYTEDIALFNSFDLSLQTSFGVEIPLADFVTLSAASRLTWGISDVNARAWRFPDLRNNYTASRNYLWGLKLGVFVTIW